MVFTPSKSSFLADPIRVAAGNALTSLRQHAILLVEGFIVLPSERLTSSVPNPKSAEHSTTAAIAMPTSSVVFPITVLALNSPALPPATQIGAVFPHSNALPLRSTFAAVLSVQLACEWCVAAVRLPLDAHQEADKSRATTAIVLVPPPCSLSFVATAAVCSQIALRDCRTLSSLVGHARLRSFDSASASVKPSLGVVEKDLLNVTLLLAESCDAVSYALVDPHVDSTLPSSGPVSRSTCFCLASFRVCPQCHFVPEVVGSMEQVVASMCVASLVCACNGQNTHMASYCVPMVSAGGDHAVCSSCYDSADGKNPVKLVSLVDHIAASRDPAVVAASAGAYAVSQLDSEEAAGAASQQHPSQCCGGRCRSCSLDVFFGTNHCLPHGSTIVRDAVYLFRGAHLLFVRASQRVRPFLAICPSTVVQCLPLPSCTTRGSPKALPSVQSTRFGSRKRATDHSEKTIEEDAERVAVTAFLRMSIRDSFLQQVQEDSRISPQLHATSARPSVTAENDELRRLIDTAVRATLAASYFETSFAPPCLSSTVPCRDLCDAFSRHLALVLEETIGKLSEVSSVADCMAAQTLHHLFPRSCAAVYRNCALSSLNVNIREVAQKSNLARPSRETIALPLALHTPASLLRVLAAKISAETRSVHEKRHSSTSRFSSMMKCCLLGFTQRLVSIEFIPCRHSTPPSSTPRNVMSPPSSPDMQCCFIGVCIELDDGVYRVRSFYRNHSNPQCPSFAASSDADWNGLPAVHGRGLDGIEAVEILLGIPQCVLRNCVQLVICAAAPLRYTPDIVSAMSRSPHKLKEPRRALACVSVPDIYLTVYISEYLEAMRQIAISDGVVLGGHSLVRPRKMCLVAALCEVNVSKTVLRRPCADTLGFADLYVSLRSIASVHTLNALRHFLSQPTDARIGVAADLPEI